LLRPLSLVLSLLLVLLLVLLLPLLPLLPPLLLHSPVMCACKVEMRVILGAQKRGRVDTPSRRR
jgi:hypothetical protein